MDFYPGLSICYQQINIGYVRLEEPTSDRHDNRNDVIPILPITRREGVIISAGEPIRIVTNEPVTLQCPYCSSVSSKKSVNVSQSKYKIFLATNY